MFETQKSLYRWHETKNLGRDQILGDCANACKPGKKTESYFVFFEKLCFKSLHWFSIEQAIVLN